MEVLRAIESCCLKEEWKETLDKILAHFAANGYGRTKLIEIYLREQMFDAALKRGDGPEERLTA